LARDPQVAAALRATPGVGREVPRAELLRFAPALAGVHAAFEPAPHHWFAAQLTERGVHGLWPGRPGYRATFLLWGAGIKPGRLPEISMLEFAGRFAEVLGVRFP
jgi:hypothetical protein